MLVLRSAAFNLYFYAVTLLACVIGIPLRIVAPARVPALARGWVRALLGGAKAICGIHVAVTGLEHLPREGAALVASQHQSAFDTLVWFGLVPLPSYVVKQELARVPLFGPLLLLAGMIPVDRQAGAAALRGLLRDTDRVRAQGRQIVIFPEGTRVAPGVRVQLQPGIAAIAARQKLPVVPVATDSGRLWGRRAFRKLPGVIHVAIGPPIPAGTARAALLSRIEEHWRSAEAAGFEPVDNSVDDPEAELVNTIK